MDSIKPNPTKIVVGLDPSDLNKTPISFMSMFLRSTGFLSSAIILFYLKCNFKGTQCIGAGW